MNRRQKIIISVTGIFLVLLLLVGLTYAYFLTKINGNENTKSISVTTANLALVYGDGSVKLVLEDYTDTCENSIDHPEGTYYGILGPTEKYQYFGYKVSNSKLIADYNSVNGYMALLNDFLNNNLLENNNTIGLNEPTRNLLKEEEWCIGDRTNAYDYETGELLSTNVTTSIANGTKFYYDAGKRLYGIGQERTATLKCNGDTMTSKIGALTADEIAFAGARFTAEGNSGFYLHNPNYIDQYHNLSLISFGRTSDNIVSLGMWGGVRSNSVSSLFASIRPAITLKSGIEISSGNGTISKPYIIK